MSPSIVIAILVGEIALMLWGISLVSRGVRRSFGSQLRLAIERGLKTRFRALLAGIGVTALMQSSTATALMVTTLAAGEAIGTQPGLAVMLGANIGTALIVQVLSFDISLVLPILFVAGYTASRRGDGRARDIGQIVMGIGILLLSLQLIGVNLAPAESSKALREVVAIAVNDPVLTLVIAGVVAWAAHSSVATIVLIMALANSGVVGLETSLLMVLGANLGTSVNPVLEADRRDASALRIPVGNLLMRAAGCLVAALLVPSAAQLLARYGVDGGHAAALFHLAFNVVLAVVFLPLIAPCARWLGRLIPESAADAEPGAPRYLDAEALVTPPIALSNAVREVLHMADVFIEMLGEARTLYRQDDRAMIASIHRMDDRLDRLFRAVDRYVGSIGSERLSKGDARRLEDILSFAINLEQAGDVIDKSLMQLARKRMKQQLLLPADTLHEIDRLHDRLQAQVKIATGVLMSQNVDSARKLVKEKEEFRAIEREVRARHLKEVRGGATRDIQITTLELDIVRDLKQIEGHIAATAYSLLESHGLLKSSRLVRS